VIRYSVFIFGLIFAAEIPAADLSGEEILRRSVAGETRQQKLRQQYTWHEHQENGPARADGSPVKVNIARDFDVIFLEGSFYRKLVAINGKPLNSKQAREEEEKMHMTAAQRMARPLAKRARRSGVPLSDILSVMDHRLLREEEVGGHKYWVVQSEPRKGTITKSQAETEALSYRYIHWIDEDEKVVVRREWEVIGEGVETKPGSRTKVGFAKNNDSVWLPDRAESLIVTGDKFGASRTLQTNTFSGYRRFTSETNIEFDDPQ
jgi:hypothetical protein